MMVRRMVWTSAIAVRCFRRQVRCPQPAGLCQWSRCLGAAPATLPAFIVEGSGVVSLSAIPPTVSAAVPSTWRPPREAQLGQNVPCHLSLGACFSLISTGAPSVLLVHVLQGRSCRGRRKSSCRGTRRDYRPRTTVVSEWRVCGAACLRLRSSNSLRPV